MATPRLLTLTCALVLAASVGNHLTAEVGHTGPWNVPALEAAPEAVWGARDGLVQPVTYVSEPFNGKPSKVFAYYACPNDGKGPYPGIVLVHGGGGKAFREWAEHWAKHGYAALAMDLAGNGQAGKLDGGGPDQSDAVKFRDFTAADVTDMWTYQAVAAVIRGHSLLLHRPDVDPKRTALTGISWGGYLTCIVAGLDHRFKAAVPVYGCGFLDEDSYWVGPNFSKMDAARRERWVSTFDPSRYLGAVSCPTLFVDGTNDFAYPLDSLRKSYRLVQAPKAFSIKVNLPHGHIWTFKEVDTFIDSILAGGPPLPVLGEATVAKDRIVAPVTSAVPLAKVELCWTTSVGPWQKRTWTTAAGQLLPTARAAEFSAAADLPAERPLACFLLVTDGRGLCVSTAHVEMEAAK